MTTLLRIASLWVVLTLGLACHRDSDPLAEIRSLQGEGHYAASIEPLRRLLDRDPEQVEANLLLGTALLRTGQAGLAVWSLGKASESPQYAVQAGMLLARAMLESRSAPDAVSAIDRVLAIEPDNREALSLRAEAYRATGRLEEARADLDRVLELDPESLDPLVPRVTTLIALGEIEEAGAALATARERFEDAGPEVPEVLRARLCVANGLFAFEGGDKEAAESQYAECLEQFPTDPLVVTETASYYQRTGRGEEATALLRRAYEETHSTYFRIGLARRMGALGDAAEQERLLREEAQERPSWPAWFSLADLYARREAYDEALDAFEQALDASSSPNPRLLFAYADTLVQAGRYDRAREVAGQIAAPELRQLIRGRVLLAEGDAKGALRAFEAGIRLWPNNPGGRFLAGQAAERLGNFARASSHYREALRAGPGESDAGLALAELYEARGDLKGALDAVGRHIRSHRSDPRGYLAAIRIAHALERDDLEASGLAWLARLPDQRPVALAEEAKLATEQSGPKRGVEVIEGAELDLTDPANAPALRVLLEQLAAQGQHTRAQQQIAAALDANPDVAVFHELRGRTLRAAGAPAQEVRAAFQRAVALDPREARALEGLAELTAQGRDREAAVAFYDRAVAADPNDPAPAGAAAQLLLDAGQSDAAEARLVRLLEAHPRDGAAALTLADLAAERGEHGRALALAKRAAWLGTPGAEAALKRFGGAEPATGTTPAPQDED